MLVFERLTKYITLQGYDPIFIAATLGLDTLALDISTTALQAARE